MMNIILKKNKIILLILLILSFKIFPEEITKDKLDILITNKLITQEEYEIYLSSIGEGNFKDAQIYKLMVNGRLRTESYKIQKLGGKDFYPLLFFLESINFKNIERTEDKIILLLGDHLKKIEIDLLKEKVTSLNSETKEIDIKDKIIIEKDEVYLEKDIFEELFLIGLSLHERSSTIKMSLNFNSPDEVKIILDRKIEDLERERAKETVVYENQRKLFEIGNARIEALQIIDHNDRKNDGKKTKTDWESSIEYQGALFYGDILTKYDFKEKKLLDTKLRYNNLYANHNLEIGSYVAGGSNGREWGIKLEKDRGYYVDGKQYIIKENVPIGSKVELIYLGFPIEVQYAQDGVVEFKNSQIQADRRYELKIYTPNNEIYIKEINTTQDFNQQNKNEIEYDINIRENHEMKKIKTNVDIYYGITDNLTIGGGYQREPEEVNGDIKDIDSIKTEMVYSNFIFNNYAYTFKFGTEKLLETYLTDENENYSNAYSYNFLGQIQIDKLRLTYERDIYGDFYQNKFEDRYEIKYEPIKSLTLNYEYSEIKEQNNKKNNNYNYGFTYDYTIKDLLTTFEYQSNKDEQTDYRISFYYTGFENFNINWENNIEGKRGDYRTTLTLYNNNLFDILDYNLGISYSEIEKEKLVFGFTLKYDDFFKMSGRTGDSGQSRVELGIDSVVDLKTMKRISNIDSSRVQVKTYIDKNGNGVFDIGEKIVDNVDVTIGQQTLTTNDEGIAYFSGVPNSILMDLKPKIKKPSFVIDDKKIKIKGRSASTIDIEIGVKPMITLFGMIDIDKTLRLNESEKIELYDDILVKIKDIDGKVIELTIPDETGIFTVSGLFSKKYQIEVEYLGTKFNIANLYEKIELAYNENNYRANYVLNVTEKSISIK